MATGFSYQLQLSLPLTDTVRLCGLDFLFALLFKKRVGASRQVSTPSPAKARAWLGITIPIKEKASPNLRSSTSGVSAGALKLL